MQGCFHRRGGGWREGEKWRRERDCIKHWWGSTLQIDKAALFTQLHVSKKLHDPLRTLAWSHTNHTRATEYGQREFREEDWKKNSRRKEYCNDATSFCVTTSVQFTLFVATSVWLCGCWSIEHVLEHLSKSPWLLKSIHVAILHRFSSPIP